MFQFPQGIPTQGPKPSPRTISRGENITIEVVELNKNIQWDWA